MTRPSRISFAALLLIALARISYSQEPTLDPREVNGMSTILALGECATNHRVQASQGHCAAHLRDDGQLVLRAIDTNRGVEVIVDQDGDFRSIMPFNIERDNQSNIYHANAGTPCEDTNNTACTYQMKFQGWGVANQCLTDFGLHPTQPLSGRQWSALISEVHQTVGPPRTFPWSILLGLLTLAVVGRGSYVLGRRRRPAPIQSTEPGGDA